MRSVWDPFRDKRHHLGNVVLDADLSEMVCVTEYANAQTSQTDRSEAREWWMVDGDQATV